MASKAAFLSFLLFLNSAQSFVLNTRSECERRDRESCDSCADIDSLRILTLNTWGLSWFKDLPIPSADEPYDLASVIAAVRAAGVVNPSPFLGLLDVLTPQQILFTLNPSLKKEERLNSLCDFLNHEKFDVVFLQELWYKKDHDFLSDCVKHNYHSSDYDEESCGAANGLIALNCSGLTILSKYELHNQRHVDFDLGLSSTETIFALYYDHFTHRQAIYTDIKVKDCHIRLVTSHLSPTFNETDQNRDKRLVQANQIVEGLGCGYDLAILGMDMNDIPIRSPDPQPYEVFIEAGFQDSANPKRSHYNENENTKVFFPTYGNPGNTWSGEGSNELTQAIDYIMTKSMKHHDYKSFVEVDDFKVVDLKTQSACRCSFSDHSAVMAKIKPRCTKKE